MGALVLLASPSIIFSLLEWGTIWAFPHLMTLGAQLGAIDFSNAQKWPGILKLLGFLLLIIYVSEKISVKY